MRTPPLTAPYPYEGSKRRWRERIWQAFGATPDVAPPIYLEPFAGSLAVLLGNPCGPAKREVICDLSPSIANFWRSIQRDPDAVAQWADYPTVHLDLTARNAWLSQWAVDNTERVRSDADYYDAQAAGWWAWAKSNMIGLSWRIVHADTARQGQRVVGRTWRKAWTAQRRQHPECQPFQRRRTRRGYAAHRRQHPTR